MHINFVLIKKINVYESTKFKLFLNIFSNNGAVFYKQKPYGMFYIVIGWQGKYHI